MLICLQTEPKAFWGYYNMLGIQPIYPSVWRRQVMDWCIVQMGLSERQILQFVAIGNLVVLNMAEDGQ